MTVKLAKIHLDEEITVDASHDVRCTATSDLLSCIVFLKELLILSELIVILTKVYEQMVKEVLVSLYKVAVIVWNHTDFWHLSN